MSTLDQSIENYSCNRDKFLAQLKEDEEIESYFTDTLFPISKLKTMTPNEYMSGCENSFCYWLETGLRMLGDIRGSFASKKFGIYYNKKKGSPIYIKKFGTNEKEAFENIRNEIVKLVNLDSKSNPNGVKEAIISNKISPIFKGKILSTYYPEKYLNIFAKDRLKYYIKVLYGNAELNCEKLDPVSLREILLSFKENNSIMKGWSIHEFSLFLYLYYPYKK